MGFMSDFVESCEFEYNKFQDIVRKASTNMELLQQLQEAANNVADGSIKRMGDSMRYFADLAAKIRQAKIIRISGEQCKVFLDIPTVKDQDARWIKLPFQYIWLQPDDVFNFMSVGDQKSIASDVSWDVKSMFDDREVGVRGVLLEEIPAGSLFKNSNIAGGHPDNAHPSVKGLNGVAQTIQCRHNEEKVGIIQGCSMDPDPHVDAVYTAREITLRDGRTIPFSLVDRMLGVHFISPIPETKFNEDSAVLLIMKDGRLDYSVNDSFKDRRLAMLRFAIHVVNFLSSPSVKLVANGPAPELQKARAKKGKPPLPGWYEITYRKHLKEYTKEKVSLQVFHHSFRYDVRGHFKKFERGPMSGRVIWCPPHQRGLANELYKPKVYRTNTEFKTTEELWRG